MTRNEQEMNARRGFTLIEVLVALSIFAIMSGIAFRGLGSVIDARTRNALVLPCASWQAVQAAPA